MKRAERPGESETEPEAKKNKQDSLKQLFEIAAELSQISARPESNDDKLYYACKFGRLDMLEHLITQGIDINIVMQNQFTPLAVASKFSQKQIVEKLLTLENIQVNQTEFQNGLVLACENGDLEIIELLLGHPNIDVNAGIPLFGACRLGKKAVVERLLKVEALDVNKEKINY